jgi:TetR/AcrR family transcriptional regulator, mexCD-oprJ operon repressor
MPLRGLAAPTPAAASRDSSTPPWRSSRATPRRAWRPLRGGPGSRATLYAHFPTREALIGAVTERAIAEAAEMIASGAPADGDPREALERVLVSAWRTLGRYHALVEINARLAPARLRAVHGPVLGQLRPLLERGQGGGAFNRDLPRDWMLTVILELIHAASREVTSGRLSKKAAERALLASVAGALSPPPNRHRARVK